MELELRRSEGERRLYLLDGIGTLRLTNLLASTGVAEEDGRRWSFGKRGLLRSVVRATDEAGVEVGEFAPRRARRAGSLRWDGHELTLRPASKWRSRYALVSGEQELATVEAKGWGQASGRSHALRGRSAGARPSALHRVRRSEPRRGRSGGFRRSGRELTPGATFGVWRARGRVTSSTC